MSLSLKYDKTMYLYIWINGVTFCIDKRWFELDYLHITIGEELIKKSLKPLCSLFHAWLYSIVYIKVCETTHNGGVAVILFMINCIRSG